MKIHLVTFADGSPPWRASAVRLAAQANETGWFSSTTALHLEHLPPLSETWFSAHHDFIRRNARGLGYWIWKPFLILEILRRIPKGDCLLYADAGYEISAAGRLKFESHLDLAREYNLLAFDIQHPVSKWTKSDTLHYFGVQNRPEILSSRQIQSGLIFCRNTASNILLMSHWAECCVARNYTLVDDSPSVSSSTPDFIEHRHDQAILTLLLLLLRTGYVTPDESYHADLWKKGTYLPEIPFHSFRNKTGTRMIPQPATI
jgi:hypothetical protein